MILGETIELAYTLIKYTYMGASGIYCWYYEIYDEKDIKQLTERIRELELKVGK